MIECRKKEKRSDSTQDAKKLTMDANQQLEETKTPLLIFDGDCGFCTSSASWICSKNAHINISSWQSIDLSTYDLTEPEVSSAVYWIDSTGKKFRGHFAIGKVLKESNQIWRKLAGSIISSKVFTPFGKILYRLIAKYRHKLPGSTESCAIK